MDFYASTSEDDFDFECTVCKDEGCEDCTSKETILLRKSLKRQEIWDGIHAKFKIFRTERVHCDIVFVGSNKRAYYAHQTILFAVSDYFQALVKHREKISDASSETKEIRVNLSDMGIEESNFVTLLDIIYDEFEDFGDNAISLLFDASKLLMKDVTKTIATYIVRTDLCKGGKNSDNFFHLVAFPVLNEYSELSTYLRKCFRKNVATLSSMKEFLELPFETLNVLSLFKNICWFSSPMTFINFIGKWISYDINHRMILVRKIIKFSDPKNTMNHESLPDTIIDDILQQFKNGQLNISYFRLILMGVMFEPICSWFYQNLSDEDDVHLLNWFDSSVKPEEILVGVEKNSQTTNTNGDDIKIPDDVESDET